VASKGRCAYEAATKVATGGGVRNQIELVGSARKHSIRQLMLRLRVMRRGLHVMRRTHLAVLR
jgi:hypothetical protein